MAVGLDWPQEETFPRLAYAASDAASFAAKIQTLGFRTELLTGESATLSGVHKALDAAAAATAEDDLLVIYYAGMTFRSTDVNKSASKPVLVLPTFDFRIAELANGLTLPALVAGMASSARGDVLIVLDGCHGTVGLGDPGGEPAIGTSRTAALQVMAASQDDEFGLEISSLGGGAFTQLLLRKIDHLANSSGGASTNAILAALTPELSLASSGKQRPKLVTIAGSGDIVLHAGGVLKNSATTPK